MIQAKPNLTSGSIADGNGSAWPAVLLAALPHLLLATSMAMTAAFAGPAPSWFDAYGYGLLVIVGGALLLAWRRGWPLWSGSWAGYWLLVPYLWSVEQLTWRSGLDYLLALPPLAIGLFLFIRRPLYGLLALVAPLLLVTRVFTFGLEVVVGSDWVWSGVWLLLALTAGGIVWWGNIRGGVLLMVAFQLATGLIITVARSYLPYRAPPGMDLGPRAAPGRATLVNDFVPPTLATITLPLALLLLYPLERLAGRGGRWGRRSYRLLLLGMAIASGSVLVLRARPALVDGTSRTVTAVAVAAGLVLALGAAVTLIRAVWSGPDSRWQDLLLPLLAAFAPLVVFSLADPFVTAGQYSVSFQMQLILSYLGVLTWAVLAILILIGERGGRIQPEMTMEAVPG